MPNAAMQYAKVILPALLFLFQVLVIPPLAEAQGIYQQTNYWCDMRKQPTGSGDYRNPMQVLYNDNQQPLTWRPMSEDINAQPKPPSPTPADVINRDGGMSQVPGLSGIQNSVAANTSAAANTSPSATSSNGSAPAGDSSAGGTITQTSVTGQLSNYVMSDTNPDYSSLINP